MSRIYEHHGDTGTRLHRIWKAMKCRCYTVNHPTYPGYGGRGISICDQWRFSYLTFKAWAMSNGYAQTLELDRINVNGNYEPANCRWISHHAQTLNRRDTLYIRENGELIHFGNFCEKHGISIHTANEWSHYGVLQEKLKQRTDPSIQVVRGGALYANHTSG